MRDLGQLQLPLSFLQLAGELLNLPCNNNEDSAVWLATRSTGCLWACRIQRQMCQRAAHTMVGRQVYTSYAEQYCTSVAVAVQHVALLMCCMTTFGLSAAVRSHLGPVLHMQAA